MKKKIVINNHHPDRDKYPDYTIPLRAYHHLFIRRLEQLGVNGNNLWEISNLLEAVQHVYHRMRREIKDKK